MNCIWHYDSPLGGMTMVSDGQALTWLWFDRQRYFGLSFDRQRNVAAGLHAVDGPSAVNPSAVNPPVADPSVATPPIANSPIVNSPVFEATCRWLDEYFAGWVPDFTPPLALRGTPFREAVWEILLTIPFGQTMTYGEIAARLAGQRTAPSAAQAAAQAAPRVAAQAVGGAVGHNPIAIIVPCHRVIGADGSLTGYAAGLDRKRRLLQLEKIIK